MKSVIMVSNAGHKKEKEKKSVGLHSGLYQAGHMNVKYLYNVMHLQPIIWYLSYMPVIT